MDARGTTSQGDASAWGPGECEGSEYCPPRCPRFFDRHGEPMLVRPYDDSHRESLEEMYVKADPSDRTLGVPPVSRGDIAEWLEYLRAEGWNLLALHGGEVVGHAGTVPVTGGDADTVVFVRRTYRNRGVGTELLKHAIATAADEGCDGVKLLVAAGNDDAKSVFHGLGFDVTNRWEMDLEMRLSCSDPLAADVRRPPAERG